MSARGYELLEKKVESFVGGAVSMALSGEAANWLGTGTRTAER